jgi:hypothetical protein
VRQKMYPINNVYPVQRLVLSLLHLSAWLPMCTLGFCTAAVHCTPYNMPLLAAADQKLPHLHVTSTLFLMPTRLQRCS